LALRADAKLRDVPPLQTALNDALSGRITEIISRLRNRGGTPSIAAAELRLTAEPTRDPITGKPADFYFIEPPHKPSLAPAAVATQLPVSEVYMKSNVTLQQRCALGHGEPTQHIARVRCGRPDSSARALGHAACRLLACEAEVSDLAEENSRLKGEIHRLTQQRALCSLKARRALPRRAPSLKSLLSCCLRASRERSGVPSHWVPHSHWKSNGSSSSRSNAIEHGSASAASCSNPTRCAESRPSRSRSSHWKVNAHYTRPGAVTGRPSNGNLILVLSSPGLPGVARMLNSKNSQVQMSRTRLAAAGS
jgi:hypothetical protein